MAWDLLSVYALSYALVCITPGPAVLFVTSQSGWRGPSAGVRAALGIETANMIFWSLSALGLAAAIAASQSIFIVLKWIGAAYLSWLGVRAIVGSFAGDDTHAPDAASGEHAYRDGLVVGLSNPKAMLFFVALLPQFVDPTKATLAQILILATISVLISFSCNAAYAFAAGEIQRTLAHGSVKRWFDRAVGCFFLSLAAAAALYRRTA